MKPFRTPKLIALAAITAAAGLLLAGCGGGDDNDSTPTVSGSGNSGPDAGAAQELRDLAGKWGEARTKITYDLARASGSLTSDAQVIVYREAPDRRTDHIAASQTTTVIVRSDLGYACVGTGATCVLLTVEEAESSAEFVPFVGDLADSAELDAIIAGAAALESAPARNVIGRQTNCIRASVDLGGIPGEATWCFTEDGLLLAVNLSGGAQTFEVTATVIGEPEEADFEPPYAIATIPP